jgi:hypothetical protein
MTPNKPRETKQAGSNPPQFITVESVGKPAPDLAARAALPLFLDLMARGLDRSIDEDLDTK